MDNLGMKVIGHVLIKEHSAYSKQSDGSYVLLDEGITRVDKCNAVHPQNMARVIARALANEYNFYIHRMGFGNGGTQLDIAENIVFNPPRDGINVGDNYWEARMYNETYSEIVDDSNVNIGGGVGSSPGDDPTSIPHVSGPGVRSIEDLTINSTVSTVTVTVVLNPAEPTGQVGNQTGDETNLESDFTFDEIALFTDGAPHVNTAGYQNVDVGNKRSSNDTGLSTNTAYSFLISVNGATSQSISITTPSVGTGDGTNAPINAITYGDLILLLNSPGSGLNAAGAFASITDDIPTQLGGSETFGFLRFTSNTTGSTSSVQLVNVSLFSNLDGYNGITTQVNGLNAGVRNDPTNPTTERERMLTHLVFAPVLKSADRVLSIVYSLNVVVARST